MMILPWDIEKVAEKNKRKGDAFLAKNQKKKGVVALPSGLQYKVIREGTGRTPQLNDTVLIHYRGTLINKKEFDSSRRGPRNFQVSRLIPGWAEALQLMKEGAKWKLFIPPYLAYGGRGAGNKIGPNATLIFEIELIAIRNKEGG